MPANNLPQVRKSNKLDSLPPDLRSVANELIAKRFPKPEPEATTSTAVDKSSTLSFADIKIIYDKYYTVPHQTLINNNEAFGSIWVDDLLNMR